MHWLVITSFIIVLSRKQTRYRDVLTLLHAFRKKQRFTSVPGEVRAGTRASSVLLADVAF